MNSSFNQILLALLFALITMTQCKELYDANTSSIINLTKKNFDTQITNNRAKAAVSFVHYYTFEDGKSKGYKDEFEKLAKDYEGMFKIAAMNCKDYKDLCEKEDIREFPSFMMYPPLPAPVMKYEGKIETAAIVSYVGKFIPNRSQELNNNNFDNFLNTNHNLPKVILFTDKKGVPLIFKSLSINFEKKVEFGVVRSEFTGIVSKYKVTQFPKIMAIGVDKKTKFYEGETKYKPIFDFVNIYSETFFKVGEDKTKVEPPQKEKAWLNEKFPEVNKDSGNELCFKVDGVVCVLLVIQEKPREDLITLFTNIQNWLSPKIDRGIKYKFGWINSSVQKEFMNSVEMKMGSGPTLMLVNPGKRKRYYVHENGLTEEDMKSVFDKLASGEIKFNLFKGNSIPDME